MQNDPFLMLKEKSETLAGNARYEGKFHKSLLCFLGFESHNIYNSKTKGIEMSRFVLCI